MASTDTWTDSSPTAGSNQQAPNTFAIVPTGGTTVSCTCKAFNSSGGLVTVASFTALILAYPAGTVKNSFTGSGVNTVNVTYNAVGGDVLSCGYKVGSITGIDHITVDCTFTGSERTITAIFNNVDFTTRIVDGTHTRISDGAGNFTRICEGGVLKFNGTVWSLI
jgi:hypothetical protein